MPSALKFINRQWFRLFFGGTVLFFASEQLLKYTGDPSFVPIVLLLGAFIVPVAFVAFFYGQERGVDRLAHVEAPLVIAATCFLVGGVIGLITAGFLEYATLGRVTVSSLLMVSLIEESAKLIFPVAIYWRAHYTSEADGLLFGVAAGMGFAALETMGYGMVALIRSQGDVGVLQDILLIRGLLSPVGHATWTGMICAALWRQRQRTGKSCNLNVVWVFILAIVLHSLWNTSGASGQVFIAFAGYLLVSIASLVLLIRNLRQAKRPIAQKEIMPS